MNTMASLFDGIGGFPRAGERYGIKTLWASEVEAFPIAVTKIRFPDMQHVGDITKLKGEDLPPVDIVCGGSPCQDVSQAGRRAGLAGARSGLFFEQIRVIKEMRDADVKRGRANDAVRPRYMLWENVAGALSSGTEHGEDFRVVLEEVCGIAACGFSVPRPPGGRWESSGAILGEEFSVAWRMVDAQYWFVPQRRKRIFLVADFGGHSASKILFEQDRLFGNFTPREKTVQDAPRRTGEGVKTASRSVAFACNQRDEVRNLHDVSAAVCAHPSVKQQTFVTAIPINTQIATRHKRLGEGTGIGIGNEGDPAYTLQEAHSHAVFCEERGCLTPWDTQQARIFTADGIAPTVAGADGGGGRNPAGLLFEERESLTAWDVQSRRIHDENGVWPALYGSEGGGRGYVAAFSAGQGAKAGGIGYAEDLSPTLKAAPSGTNMTPSVLCLNDQGGQRMDLSEDICGTLRAQMTGHPPIVMGSQQGGAEICEDLCPTLTSAAGTSGNNQPVIFENHGIDARYTGPHDVASTISARWGTGGNNCDLTINIPSPVAFSFDSAESNSMKSKNPFSGCREVDTARTIDTTTPCPSKNQGGIAILHTEDTYAIAGNIIGRKEKNGGNGFGYQHDVSYTITATDRHAVYSQQRSDEYMENDVVSTQAARQYKDATDLVCEMAVYGQHQYGNYREGCATLRAEGGDNGGGSENLVSTVKNLIRRLIPLECERLMDFPDYWTDIKGASDSKRYKALGNSVVVSCVEYIMRGIAYFLSQEEEGDQ